MGLKVNQIHKMKLYHRPIMSPISLKLPSMKNMEAYGHYLCDPGSLSVPHHPSLLPWPSHVQGSEFRSLAPVFYAVST